MAYKVFVCYSNQDKKTAEIICAKLEENDIQCWMAPRDITSGKDWDEAIIEAISLTPIMVMVFSVNSNDSEYCKNEVHAAFDLKKYIIPVLIDNSIPHGGIALYLQRKQWLNAQQGLFEPQLNKIISEIKAHLAQIAAREEAARAKEDRIRQEMEAAARARLEAEEAKKARVIEDRIKQERELAVKEKELLGKIAALEKAKLDSEEAMKKRDEIIRAQNVTDRDAKIKKTYKDPEAKTRPVKEAKQTIQAPDATTKATQETENPAIVDAGKPHDPIKPFWLWAGVIFIVIVALGATVYFVKFAPGRSPVTTAPVSIPTITSNSIPVSSPTPASNSTLISNSIPTSSPTLVDSLSPTVIASLTPTPTFSLTPTNFPIPIMDINVYDYIQFIIDRPVVDKAEINAQETFKVKIWGIVSCTQDIPIQVNSINVVPQIIARNPFAKIDIMLSLNTSMKSDTFPTKKGESVVLSQTLPLQFPEQTESGNYEIIIKIKEIKIDIGSWMDITQYIPTLEEYPVGTVKYNKISI